MIIDELRKARRALQTASVDLDAGDGAASVNRSYYAMYYAARAMLMSAGVAVPKTHSALISAFSRHFVESGLLPRQLGRDFNKIEEQRRYVDYIADEEIPLDVASEMLNKATTLVDAVVAHLSSDADPAPIKPTR
jgi:uncharacterized protein (UPF0332 family)